MTQGYPSVCRGCGRPGGPPPLLVTSFVATEATARAITNVGMGKLFAVVGLAGAGVAGLLVQIEGAGPALAVTLGAVFAVLLVVLIRAKQRRIIVRTLFPGAQWWVEYFGDRFTICDPLGTTTTIAYRTIAAITVKPAYGLLQTVTGNRLLLPAELVPPAAQAFFTPAPR